MSKLTVNQLSRMFTKAFGLKKFLACNNHTSSIRQSLYDRPGEVVLVADSFMMGFDGLHLIMLTPSFLTINDWLQKSQQGKHEMYIRSIGSEDISLVSKLRSFIAS